MDVLAVCVFCSSSSYLPDVYYEAGQQLGQVLADAGITLIFGGTNIGLMKTICDAVLEGGGQAVGVIPRLIYKMGTDPRLAETIVVEDLYTRKQIMEDRADAFIAMPGGIGTMDEFYEAIIQKQFGFHSKPIVLVNINHYFDKWLEFFADGMDQQFMQRGERDLFQVVATIEEILPYFAAYEPVFHPDKWL